ncbi:MAG: ABC transporter ATP-binding protein [Desulfovermiculus sp.]|nr:ABC transporter ATP-binding protein [Desulfovermiculus sp.]
MEAGVLNAVQDVSFTLEKGETVCLVGESGCGKSLTSLAIMNLLPGKAQRTCQNILFQGQDISQYSEQAMANIRGKKMAMIFQEPMTSLNPSYTIGNQLEETLLRHSNASRKVARDRAVYLLEKVGITGAGKRLQQYPHQLSGGLRQRVMIAMGLMCEPVLEIADEPTTALDVTIQAQILSLLASLQQEMDMGMILITHDLGVVARMAHKVVVMYCGQVVESGLAKRIFEAPLHPYTQGLLECIPIPGKTSRETKLGTIPGLVPTPIGQLRGCAFSNRCAYVFEECTQVQIPLKEHDSQRAYRCLLSPEQCLHNAGAWQHG